MLHSQNVIQLIIFLFSSISQFESKLVLQKLVLEPIYRLSDVSATPLGAVYFTKLSQAEVLKFFNMSDVPAVRGLVQEMFLKDLNCTLVSCQNFPLPVTEINQVIDSSGRLKFESLPAPTDIVLAKSGYLSKEYAMGLHRFDEYYSSQDDKFAYTNDLYPGQFHACQLRDYLSLRYRFVRTLGYAFEPVEIPIHLPIYSLIGHEENSTETVTTHIPTESPVMSTSTRGVESTSPQTSDSSALPETTTAPSSSIKQDETSPTINSTSEMFSTSNVAMKSTTTMLETFTETSGPTSGITETLKDTTSTGSSTTDHGTTISLTSEASTTGTASATDPSTTSHTLSSTSLYNSTTSVTTASGLTESSEPSFTMTTATPQHPTEPFSTPHQSTPVIETSSQQTSIEGNTSGTTSPPPPSTSSQTAHDSSSTRTSSTIGAASTGTELSSALPTSTVSHPSTSTENVSSSSTSSSVTVSADSSLSASSSTTSSTVTSSLPTSSVTWETSTTYLSSTPEPLTYLPASPLYLFLPFANQTRSQTLFSFGGLLNNYPQPQHMKLINRTEVCVFSPQNNKYFLENCGLTVPLYQWLLPVKGYMHITTEISSTVGVLTWIGQMGFAFTEKENYCELPLVALEEVFKPSVGYHIGAGKSLESLTDSGYEKTGRVLGYGVDCDFMINNTIPTRLPLKI